MVKIKEQISDLRKLQLEELSLLKILIKYCDDNNLKYYLLGGTLLGAVRHKGFIPWDDDVDVCMPRDDYNLLIKIMEENLQKPYKLITYKNDPNYRYAWARIISENIKIINRSANIPREEYAWIDIIPLDGYPNKGIKRFFYKAKMSFLWNLNNLVQFDELVDQKRKRSWKGKIALKIANHFKKINKFIDYKKTLYYLDSSLEKIKYDSDTEYVINYLCSEGFREVFPRNSLQEGVYLEFEGVNMRCPTDYPKILDIIYGPNYMEYPPEEERNKHNSEVIKSNEEISDIQQ